MGRAEREKDQFRRAKLRLRRIQHYETDHLQNPQASSRAHAYPSSVITPGLAAGASSLMPASLCKSTSST
jgi:hypothetical protein